jgi:GNAT superfamily N-acetyltransferase
VSDVTVRRATADDLPAILALLQASMHRQDDPRFEQLFRWKHIDNAFGPSLMWVACDGERVIGFRVFMRWEFQRDGATQRAVRAVDTATHPDFQGRGIFTRLTTRALDDARDEGIDFVYNTPNDQSRPGYLKMGWQVAGRAPAALRPTRIMAIPALLQARTAASHWSEPTQIGVPFESLVERADSLQQLLVSRPPAKRLRTAATVSSLTWRYGSPLLGYRAVLASEDVRDGVAFLRVRQRGRARETALVELIMPEHGNARLLVRAVERACRRESDYLLAIGAVRGFVRVTRMGPVVTTRAVASDAPASIDDFELSLGDVELF